MSDEWNEEVPLREENSFACSVCGMPLTPEEYEMYDGMCREHYEEIFGRS